VFSYTGALPSGRLTTAPKSVGYTDRAGRVRSIGGMSLNPAASAAAIIGSGPSCSAAISANDELQDFCRITKRVPPQSLSSKLPIGRVVNGGVYDRTTG
jgi:hypothetical protein